MALYEKIEDVNYDGLISNTEPAVEVAPITVRKLGAAGTLVRGTVMALSSGTAGDGKCVILGTTAVSNETLTAAYILADDLAVGTSADEKVAAYSAGCFDPDKLTVKTGYTMTAADIDALRKYGIKLKAAQ